MNHRGRTYRDDGENSRRAGEFTGTIFPRRAFHLFLIAALGVVVYSNTFHVPFIFDDQPSISENPVIREVGNFLRNPAGYESYPRRYVGYLTLALNYWMGGLDVTGYHVFNLAVHIANAFLVYALVRITFRTPFFAVSGPRFHVSSIPAQNPKLKTANIIALFAGLLFVVHPLQTQAVTYIVQRLTSLMTMFYLLATVLYAWMRVYEEAGEGSRRGALGLYLGSLASAVLAMKTKENAFTLPLVIALYEWLFFRGSAGKRIVRLIPLFATMLIIPLSMIDIHRPIGEVLSDVSEVTQHKALLSRPEYLFTQFRVIVTYLRLLVFPVNQNLDYDYPLYHSLFELPVLASFLLLAAIAGLALFLWRRSRTGAPELRLASFGIFWFFLALAVESSLIPITDVIYEHRVYLSSGGAFIAAATLLVTLAVRCPGETVRKVALYASVTVIAALGVMTFQRNRVWGSNLTLWEDVVGKSPKKARGYNNLGAALSEVDRKEEAIAALRQALVIDPEHTEAYYNLGRIYLFYPGRLGDAIAALQRAIELKPDYDEAYVNLSAAFIKEGKPAEAIRLCEAVIARAADRPDAHFNLGVAYSLAGNLQGAAREAAVLRQLDPGLAGQLEQFLNRPAGGRER